MILIADNYMKAGAKKQAEELCDKLITYCKDQVAYFNTLNDADKSPNSSSFGQTDFCRTALGFLSQSAAMNDMKPLGDKLQKALTDISASLPASPQQYGPPQQ